MYRQVKWQFQAEAECLGSIHLVDLKFRFNQSKIFNSNWTLQYRHDCILALITYNVRGSL